MKDGRMFDILRLLLIIALLLGRLAQSTALAQTTTDEPPPPKGLRPDAPAYGLRGSYPVGTRSFVVESDDSTVSVVAWYPALNLADAPQEVFYSISTQNDFFSGLPIKGRAIQDAVSDTANGPYPLVIFSPGLAGWSQANSYLLEHLASYGFVVMASDPRGETFEEFWEGAATRPMDTRLLISTADELTAADGDWPGLIDTEHIAVAGHSSGGWTALMGGGAQFDFSWCSAYAEFVAEHEGTDCNQFDPHQADIAELLGLESVPEGVWPPQNDPRVDAVIALSPDGDIWGANFEGVSVMEVPALLMTGSGDTTNIPEVTTYPIYEHLSSANKALVVLENADHMVFFNQCRDTPWMEDGFFWACSDAIWDMDRAHDLINHFATAFLLAELKDDAEAAAALASDQVSFPGVEYREMGYGAEPEATTPHGIRFDAPPYAIHGAYAPGVRHFAIEPATENERPLNLTVWYPALNPGGDVPAYTYRMAVEAGQKGPWGVNGHALANGRPDLSGGPYPLVIYSHAHTSFSQEAPYFAEHLASRGFVLMAVDHEDNELSAFGQRPWRTEYQRPDEVRRQIVFAETLTADGPLAGLIDTEQIGVVGSSLGGGTALAAGGAQLDLDSFSTLCASDSPAITTYVLGADCVNVLENQEGLAKLAGLDGVPDGLWPDWGDEKVDAVIALVPTVAQFGEAGIQAVDVPTLLVRGLADPIVGMHHEMYKPYDNLRVQRKIEVGMENAAHMIFFPTCQDAPDIVALGLSLYCTDRTWDKDRAHDLINHFATAFLLAELKGDTEASATLAAENVNFLGIEYRAEGYNATTSLPVETVAEIESIVEKTMADFPIPGVAMCIVQGGEVVYNKGFGVAEVGTDRPITSDSIFEMYSISKSMTGMAAMQLVEQGKVDLDAPVVTYLPDFAGADSRFAEITVRMLMNHTSGLPLPDPQWNTPAPDLAGSLQQAVREIATQELLFDPGSSWSYNSQGFDVLGALVVQVSGEPFEMYMQRHLLEPLGMASATFLPSQIEPVRLALPHISAEDGAAVVGGLPYDPRGAPAGHLNASCTDMTRWAQALLTRGEVSGTAILTPESLDAMWTVEADTGWDAFWGPHYGTPLAHYGLGWVLGQAEGHRLVGHPGGGTGYNTQFELAPDDGLAVILLSNWLVPGVGYPTSNAATDVMYALLGINPQ